MLRHDSIPLVRTGCVGYLKQIKGAWRWLCVASMPIIIIVITSLFIVVSENASKTCVQKFFLNNKVKQVFKLFKFFW